MALGPYPDVSLTKIAATEEVAAALNSRLTEMTESAAKERAVASAAVASLQQTFTEKKIERAQAFSRSVKASQDQLDSVAQHLKDERAATIVAPASNVHPITTQGITPEEAAAAYERKRGRMSIRPQPQKDHLRELSERGVPGRRAREARGSRRPSPLRRQPAGIAHSADGSTMDLQRCCGNGSAHAKMSRREFASYVILTRRRSIARLQIRSPQVPSTANGLPAPGGSRRSGVVTSAMYPITDNPADKGRSGRGCAGACR